jgi:hypothetical protein
MGSTSLWLVVKMGGFEKPDVTTSIGTPAVRQPRCKAAIRHGAARLPMINSAQID